MFPMFAVTMGGGTVAKGAPPPRTRARAGGRGWKDIEGHARDAGMGNPTLEDVIPASGTHGFAILFDEFCRRAIQHREDRFGRAT